MILSIGHRVKIHKVVPGVGNERGDIEVVKYVVLPHGHDNYLTPRPLILDVTMTYDHYGRSTLHTNGNLTDTHSSNVSPQSDGDLNNTTRKKILDHRRIFVDLSDPVVFIPVPEYLGSLLR